VKILVAHDSYQEPGGEDVVFDSETALLEAHGHEVLRYTVTNHDVHRYNAALLAGKTIWNCASEREVGAIIQRMRPDVMHVHNPFPLLSPSIYVAAKSAHVPVVQTLHNFRLLCPKATLRRGGGVCERCVGTLTYWPGVVHGCYHGSSAATGVIAAMLAIHSVIGTWRSSISRYIAISEFAKRKFVEGGWPTEKIDVKPNFLDHDPGMRTAPGQYALFVGRLSEEKGLATLLAAIRRMKRPPALKIAGQGPLMPAAPDAHPGVEWLGHVRRNRILDLMKEASMLIVPSEWYETGPLTIIEAFATGLPVIASRLGTMAEMVTDGVTGRLFSPADAGDLACVMDWAQTHPDEMNAMARRARQEFEIKYSAEFNYRALMQVYRAAMA
jgi:glycosyltransferase involved in cell wall biosynthesis